MTIIKVINRTNPDCVPLRVTHCVSFGSRLRGLMFKKKLNDTEAILIDEGQNSRLNTAIHMFFMNFDIAAIWIDQQQNVVDCQLARKWRPYYAPRNPARYILEANPNQLTNFHIGDRLEFLHAEA